MNKQLKRTTANTRQPVGTGRFVSTVTAPRPAGSGRIGEDAVPGCATERIVKAVRIADKSSQHVAADVNADGTIRLDATGHRSTGEDSVLRVCSILRSVYGGDAAGLGPLVDLTQPKTRRESGVDCEITRPTGKPMQIQVVRADVGQSLWRALALNKRIIGTYGGEELAGSLSQTILHKARSVPPQLRPQLILALDATIVVSHALPAAIDAFRRRHCQWAAGFGFEAIWCVGPTPSLVSSLDA